MAAVGTHVWIEDPELAWVDGQVIEVAGTTVKVETTHGKIVQVELSKTRPKDTELVTWGEDDMTRLAYLHEPGVLHNLSLRYNINQIYTYTGNILIAINPFKKLPIYDETLMDSYRGAEFGELPPHVFAVADNTYRRLINDATSQSILVSGESGAGKTETTKMLMRYLAQMGGRKVTEGRTVEQQVLESNPVLEAFGNAKTVRNNNSSRFGKFVELQFDKQGRISGAAVRTYLLERSRVCQISDPERNYHCFYMLCAAPKEITDKYKLGHPKTFHYLNQTNCFELDNLDEAKEYIATRNAMSVVGISDEEQDAIFRIVAAILHLGNVDFAKGDDADSSKPKDEKAMFHLKMAAELFKCDVKGLEKSLCKRMIVTGGEKISKSLDPDSAVASRDALAKIVYSRMFDWLVNKINSSIGQDPNSEMLIGVLDIYGFESFKINSFEQFCINLTNEKLQQHFNQHVFKAEQEEYTKEEIKWSYIDFVDNQDILELIEKKPGGMIALLDQACILPRSNHEKFAQLLYDNFMKHERFSKPKFSQTDFTIKHYAGDVTYQTNLFLDKNKDYVIQEHQDLLSASGCAFTASLFATPAEQASSKSSKFSSIGAQFKLQLQSLVETLNKTEPHYIRCIKPNNVLKPGIFENSNVLQQLRCGGVMEAIRISCAGYPTKRAFNEFLNRFGLLCPEVFDENHDEKTASDAILKKVGFKDYQIGKTKVFLRAGQMAELDARRAEVLGKSAKVIQAKFRSHHARKGYLTLRNSAITLQSMWRGKLAVKLYTDMRREEAAKVIQKHRRRYNARKKYMGLQISSCIVQAGIRGMLARDVFRFRKETKYAVLIQAAWRRYSSLHYYENLKKVALIAQCAWRSKVARKDLRQLKMAARETGALQEAKNKLEKQVEELTYLLQWERTRMDGLEKNQSQEASKLKVALQEMEEAKVQETAKLKVALKEMEKARTEETMKLQSALEEMEVQLKETYMQLEKEREIAQMAIDQQRADSEAALQQEREASKKAIEEVQEAARKAIEDAQPQLIIDTEKLEILEKENENLKCIVSSLEEKVSEAEKLYSESVRLSEERLQKAQDAEIEVEKLKNSLQSLEEKLSTVHSEEKPVKTNTVSAHRKSHSISIPSTTNENVLENGYRDIKEIKSIRPVFPSDDKSKNAVEIKQKPWKRNNEDVDVLIKCVQQDLGFSDGKPVAAWIIYKSFLHWKSFEDERTNVFDRVIEMLGSVTLNQNNDTLAYWLSNTSTLLSLLHRALKATGAAGVTPQQRRTSTLFGRVAQGFRSSTLTNSSYSNGGMVGGLDSMRQVEAKYPALLFKQQITVTVQKIYGIIRENVKAEIKAYLDLCIQAPRTAKVNMFRTPRSQPNASAQQANVNHWQKIIKCLSDLLESMQKNNVPTVLIKKIINETFSFINVQLFNSLLLRRDCCSFSNGEYVKAGLAELEQWCDDANEFAGSAWDELKHIRQAVGFLVIHQKSKKSLDEIVHELCPVLSMQQLYRISTMYQDDKYGTHSVAQDVLISMNALMAEDSNKDEGKDENSSFLLNDNCSAPLCGEEISKHIQETDFSNISCPSELYNNHSFQFLQPTAV